MLLFKDIAKRWDNLSEIEQFEILGYITALLSSQNAVPKMMEQILEQRYHNYKKQYDAISWGVLFNQLMNELD